MKKICRKCKQVKDGVELRACDDRLCESCFQLKDTALLATKRGQVETRSNTTGVAPSQPEETTNERQLRSCFFGSAKGPHRSCFLSSAKGPHISCIFGRAKGPRTDHAALAVLKDHKDRAYLALTYKPNSYLMDSPVNILRYDGS